MKRIVCSNHSAKTFTEYNHATCSIPVANHPARRAKPIFFFFEKKISITYIVQMAETTPKTIVINLIKKHNW